MKKNKRGQVGAGPANQAALLVLVIGFAIILYILMLPPAERAELLDENTSSGGTSGVKDNITILLTKEPGTLDYLAKDEIEFSIPSFNLFTKTDAVILVDFDSVYIKKSLFNYEFRNISFNVKDMENIANFMLSFNAKKHTGILKVILNGNIILNKEITRENPEPLRLPKEYLQKENTIEFQVSGPGMNFWQANEYILENIKITADLTDVSGQENRQSFLVSNQEKDLLEEGAELSFIADCNLNEVGPIEIFLNNREIYSGIPDCGQRMEIPPISRDRILEGENTLRFTSENGNYLLYSVKLKLELEEPIYPTYYFKLENNMLENLDDDSADLNITLVFSNAVDYKKGEIWLNGFITEIETDDIVYTKRLNQYAREGNNAIEIRPKKEKLEVVELKVIYAE
ncbi:hypothetical protein JXB41_01335 [Candidatus Woesearchaeota archaeon]|nr:hypothetical protein [Candidatus Woesearchaeota archaeon]